MLPTLFLLEWKRRFRNVGAICTTAAIPLVLACLLCPFNLMVASADLSAPLQILILPSAFLLPLGVFLVSRKEAKGAAALMRSLPVSPVTRTLAAYLADLALFGLAVATLAIVPLVLNAFGTPDMGAAYTALLGFFLFGAYALALARATLALPLPKGVGIGLLFGVPALTVGADLACAYLPLPMLLCDVNAVLNPVACAQGFLYGHAYLPAALLLVCLAASFLAFACFSQTAPKRRTSEILTAAVSLVLSLSLGGIGVFLPQTITTLDVTHSKTFELCGTSRDFLGNLDADVTIYYLLHGGERNADRDLARFLSHYTAASKRMRVEYIDTDESPAFAARYTTDTLSDHSFIVTAGERSMVVDRLDLHHYYNSYLNLHLTPVFYSHCLDAADYYLKYKEYGSYSEQAILYGMLLYEYSQNTVPYFDGDAHLTNAIRYVTSDDVPTVYLLGQLERNLRTKLVNKGYFFKEIASLSAIGNDCDLLLVASPLQDISDPERGILQSYLDGGGKLLLTTSYAFTKLPNLLSVLESYGLGVSSTPDLLYQKPSSDTGYQNSFYAVADKTLLDFDNADGKLTLLTPHAIRVTPTDGVVQSVWLKTSADGSYLTLSEFDKEADALTDEQTALLEERKGEYVCGVLAQKGDSRVLWISSATAFSDVGYNASKGANYEAFLAAMNGCCELPYSPLSIRPVEIALQSLTLTNTDPVACAFLFILLLPLPILIPFAISLCIRLAKKKK